MLETYCGRSCEECTKREVLQCPGCKAGPGSLYGGDCELAQCCRGKGHESCGTCAFQGTCALLRGRDHQAEYRQRRQETQRYYQEMLVKRVPVMRKWLWILFWMIVPSTIAGILGNDNMQTWAPNIYFVGSILSGLCSVVYGGILIKLSSEEERYRVAGICTVIAAVVNILVVAVSRTGVLATWSLLFTLPAAIVALVGEGYEFSAHAAVLLGVDDLLSGKWSNLWKWYVGFMAGTIGSVVLLLIVPILGFLVLLVSGIGLIVVSILKLVYLYRTANVFRRYVV